MEQTTLSPPYGNYSIGTLKRELERLRIEKALGKARKYLSHSECLNVMQTIFDGVKPDPVNGYTFDIVAAHIYGGGSGEPKHPTEPAPEPSGDPLEVLRTLLGGGASKDALKALETTTEILFTEVLAIQEQLKNRPPKVIQVVTQEGKEVGDVKEIKSKVKSIGYSVLYMKAVKALQEAMTRIETLEAKVTALEDA